MLIPLTFHYNVCMQRGFSLVELSIVLVILGLLTGGILAGQSLIRAAELRSVSTEISKYKAAMNTFRDKYFAVPGDMATATQFWGNPASCPGTAGTGTQTCNGNGDGIISGTGAANQYSENFMFWQHLANAGLIEGSYTGRAGSLSSLDSNTTNVPVSKLSPGLWFAFNWNQTYTSTSGFDGTFRDNMLQLGSVAAGSSPGTALLKPEELWNIDTKMDDGKPAYGMVRDRWWATCTTATASNQLSADYALNVATVSCTPIIVL